MIRAAVKYRLQELLPEVTLDAQPGSYFTVMAELAIADDAKAKTQQLPAGDVSLLPPFFGVPMLTLTGGASCGVRCTWLNPSVDEQPGYRR